MKTTRKALVILADGCEELEAVAIIDTLRRGGIEVCAASLKSAATVVCSRGVKIVPDAALPAGMDEALAFAREFDAVVLPGGMGGTLTLKADKRTLGIIGEAAARGAIVAAVCAAPMVLDEAGILAGRRYCCYPGIERELSGTGTFVTGVKTVTDGSVITGTGPGTAIAFALAVLKALGGLAEQVAGGMLYQ